MTELQARMLAKAEGIASEFQFRDRCQAHPYKAREQRCDCPAHPHQCLLELGHEGRHMVEGVDQGEVRWRLTWPQSAVK